MVSVTTIRNWSCAYKKFLYQCFRCWTILIMSGLSLLHNSTKDINFGCQFMHFRDIKFVSCHWKHNILISWYKHTRGMGFGLVIGFIKSSRVTTESRYNTLTNSYYLHYYLHYLWPMRLLKICETILPLSHKSSCYSI